MSKSLLASFAVLAVLSISTADAAEKKKTAPKKAKPVAAVSEPVAAPKTYSWTGAYIGAHAGWGFGSFKQFDDGVTQLQSIINSKLNSSLSLTKGSPDAFMGGLFAGYNYQIENIVTGVEADINFGQVKQTASIPFGLSGNGHTLTGSFYGSQSYEIGGSARVRIGYAFDKILPYITGGLAVGQNKFTLGGAAALDGTTIVSTGYSKTKTQYGYVLGGGLEYAVTNNLVGRIEYLYTDFGKTELGLASDSTVGSFKSGTKLQQVRAGLAYKF
jgi:outer membrane immunogenic protein